MLNGGVLDLDLSLFFREQAECPQVVPLSSPLWAWVLCSLKWKGFFTKAWMRFFLQGLGHFTNSLITEKNVSRLTINFYKSSERGRVPLALPSSMTEFKNTLQGPLSTEGEKKNHMNLGCDQAHIRVPVPHCRSLSPLNSFNAHI